MKWWIVCVVVISISLGSGCKPVPPTQSGPGGSEGLPVGADSTYFFPNDFQVRVGRQGQIFEGLWDGVPAIFLAGLWVGGQQRGIERANIVWVGSVPFSNFTSRWGEADVGVYHFNFDRFTDPSYPWPVDFGAPVRSSGSRILYGDTMVWSAMQSDFSQFVPVLSEPFENLRVTQSVYGYRRSDLRNVLFVRYDLKNMGSLPISDAYVGYYSDTDLANPFDNAVGYDTVRGLTYTYTPTPADNFTLYYAAGYAFVQAPVDEPAHGVVAHRVMWKEEHAQYGEVSIFAPGQVLSVLKGRDNNGSPMIDPATGQETTYAFSGDPITKTGWIDEARDVRSLISSGPFAVGRDDEKVVTVVWVVEKDLSLEGVLNRLTAKIDQVRLETRLWNF